MKENVRRFIELMETTFCLEPPIYEFGSFIVPGQEELSVRKLFGDKKYVGIDMRPGNGVDRILHIDKPFVLPEKPATVLCLETLEHVRNPFAALENIYRCMHGESVLIISVPFNFKIHAYPDDYWRFTQSGLATLMHQFQVVVTGQQGTDTLPHTIVGVGVKCHQQDIDRHKSIGFDIHKVVNEWAQGK